MTFALTFRHFAFSLIIALGLHGGLAAWLSLSPPDPWPKLSPLRISLSAPIEKKIVEAAQTPEPVPAPPAIPQTEPHPVVQKAEPKILSQPKVELKPPGPAPVIETAEHAPISMEPRDEPASESEPEPVREITPVQELLPFELSSDLALSGASRLTEPHPVVQKAESKILPQPKVESKPPGPAPVVEIAEHAPISMEPRDEPASESEPEPVREITPVQEPLPSELSSDLALSDAPRLDEAAITEYKRLLQAWLEKHKRYPRQARRLGIEGEGLIRIRIDHAGQTQFVDIEQGTGHRLLDRAALDMIRRATPFPPIPNGASHQEMEFVIPLSFVLY